MNGAGTGIGEAIALKFAREGARLVLGIQSGKLIQEEVSRIKTHEQKIRANLQRAKSDGQLTKREIERIDRAQRDAERKIRELEKNDNRVSSPTDQE